MIVINKKTTILFILLVCSINIFSQNRHTLSGTVRDANNNETLIGVYIYFPKIKKHITTNEYGFYSITLPEGEYEVELNNLGYEAYHNTFLLDKSLREDIQLSPSQTILKEVTVTTKESKINTRKPEMSVNRLTSAAIKKIPVAFGEVDVVRALMTLPGVTNAGEGASGFNVRGGAADQNLVLLDEANIFSSSHLFGMFSIFNPDAIKDLKLYKGGIPAQYGGRASSVLDIYQRDGNSKEFHGSGGIGIVSSKLLLEGPIAKDKGSFLVAGRTTYAQLLLQAVPDLKGNSLYFYDLNTKLSYKLNSRNNIFLSGYFGRDVLSFEGFGLNNIYGNSTLNARWNYLFSEKLFSNLSLIYSDYYYGLEIDAIGFKWQSGIKNFNLKYDFKHYLGDNLKLNYGLNAIYYNFNPGLITPTSPSIGINRKQIEKKNAFEPALYISAEQKLSDRIEVSYGLRYSLFYRLGDSNINIYQDNNPVIFNNDLKIYEEAVPTGSKFYGKNEVVADFHNLEPRFSISYSLSDNSSIKANYNRMVQYLQLISNTNSPTPIDVWTPSDNYIKPQIADQVALGYFKNIKDGDYSIETETFYKKIKNRMDYIDGANLLGNEAIEQVILNGEMRAYGIELLLKKNRGLLNGWISYTLSKSEQRTPGRTAQETGINNGIWYASGYDKTHNLSVTGSYVFNKKWSMGANFALQTGQPVSYPQGQYQYLGLNIPNYGVRNQNRLPLYHHLDLSFTLTPRKNETRKWKGEWIFSVYNVYNRKNAASINFQENSDTKQNEAIKLSIFGVIPSVVYNFKF